MRFRKTLAVGVVAVLVALPAPAFAVSASGTDPTGDTTVATNDITSLGVSLDHSTVTVTLTTATALPALTDPSWQSRDILVELAGGLNPNTTDLAAKPSLLRTNDVDNTREGQGFVGDNFGQFLVFAGQMIAFSGSDHGDVDQCNNATVNLSGTTVTLSSPAACFGYPGFVKAEAAISNGTDAGTDVAIASDLVNVSSVNAAVPGGYYVLGGDGGVFSFGNAPFYGSTGASKLNSPVVAMSSLSTGGGYRFVAGDGGVFSYGAAAFYGSMGGKPLNKPIVGMTTTPDGKGYWLVASDGGIFAYGDASFYGSMGGKPLNKPIVGMTATPDGLGYWLVASDGGIFAYGDASFYGSMGGKALNKPIVGMSTTADGKGYAFVASDGGVFAFGDQAFYGSGTNDFAGDVVGIAASGTGYHLVGAAGDVFNYGAAYDFGDPYRYDVTLNKPVVGLAESAG